MLISKSISNRKLHCCLVVLILFILIFLSIPLLLIYLANSRYEEWASQRASQGGGPNNWRSWAPPATTTGTIETKLAGIQSVETSTAANWQPPPVNCNQTISDENFHCPIGTFPCKSCPEICVEQWRNCDGSADCPDNSDENSCHDSNGAMDNFYKKIFDIRRRPAAPSSSAGAQLAKPESCTMDQFEREQCPCVFTDPRVIICEEIGLERVPNTLLSSVYKIRISNNSIQSIDQVQWPRSLTSLVLVGNKLQRLSPRTFELAPNLSKLYLTNNKLAQLDVETFAPGLHHLTSLQLENNRLTTFESQMLRYTPQLVMLHLSENQIDLPDDTSFSRCCQRLNEITLDHNRIKIIRRHWFSNMSSLIWLSLTHNEIAHIESGSFDWDYELEELNLSFNKLININRLMFARNLNIQRLYLGGNPLKPLPVDAFREILQLKSLNLSNVEFDYIKRGTFSYLTLLEFIYFAKFRYCHYAHHVRVCKPITDGLSSVEDLLAFPILKYAVWIVASVCSLGNVFVLIWRSISPHEDYTLSLFVRNLSLADLMMGIYLGAIGWQDWKFEHRFGRHAIEWMSSWQCTAIGFLATLSSELSVFILTIITVERYRSIVSTSQLDSRQERRRQALLYLTLAWLLSFLLASYPLLEWLLLSGSGNDLLDTDGYYATNGLCLPLHIDQPFTPGWQYSAFIYLGLNFSAVLLIMALYLRMYLMIMSGRQLSRPTTALFKSEKREDAILAIRFFFIVVTDCLCWIPIVVIKLMALGKVTISSAIYGWLVVFIIPINSALNPIVYTLAAPTSLRTAFCRLLERICRRMDQMDNCFGCCFRRTKFKRIKLATRLQRSSSDGSSPSAQSFEVSNTLNAGGRQVNPKQSSNHKPSTSSYTATTTTITTDTSLETRVLMRLATTTDPPPAYKELDESRELELVSSMGGWRRGCNRQPHLLLLAPQAKRASTPCSTLNHNQAERRQSQRHSQVSFASSSTKDSRSCLLQLN